MPGDSMRVLQVPDEARYRSLSTAELRRGFLIDDLFMPGAVRLVYVDLDRTIIGSVVPGETPLALPCPDQLRASAFTERRELGILNIGSAGTVTVGDAGYTLHRGDVLYVGRGMLPVTFWSANAGDPAAFYLLSYPAHADYPSALSSAAEATPTVIGDPATANRRSISRHIHLDGIRSCQLVMGVTRLDSGSVWNTMPPHTHMRRSEVYLYFGLPEGQRIVHLMGTAGETRHLIVANRQAVISPGWSIHAGVGTSNYSFCWGMGGENQEYSDMDPVSIAELL